VSSVEPAPLARRTAAFLVDQSVVLLSVVLPALALGIPAGDLLAPGRVRTLTFLLLMAAAFTYHLLFEWLTGWTPGKRPFGLRVVRDDGSRLDFRGSLLRNALRLVDGLGYWGIAVAVIVYRGDGKRLGDVVGGTLVVHSR
jgi:uncharacterized RDD family membrane protein YckC